MLFCFKGIECVKKTFLANSETLNKDMHVYELCNENKRTTAKIIYLFGILKIQTIFTKFSFVDLKG